MKVLLRKLLRSVVELSPLLAALIREVRQQWHWKSKKPSQTPYGFRFIGDPTMENGTFEPEETKLLVNILKESDVLIDIGANVGFYTCIAQNMGKEVIAFEPIPQNLHLLFRNLRENQWTGTEVWPIGLADKPEIIPIYGAHTGASVVPGWAGSSELWMQFIVVNTLDNVLAHRFHGKKLLIKVDVEGAEYSVLRGSALLLCHEPKPTWMIEIMLDIHRLDPNPLFRETFEIFWNSGYEVRTADGTNRIVTLADVNRWLSLGKCDFDTHNWIANHVGTQNIG